MKQALVMRTSMKLSQLKQMSITGGVSESVFKQAENLLNMSKYQKALFQATRKKTAASKYHSMIDFLFAELAGSYWQHRCMLFYKGKGPALKNDPEADNVFIAKWDVVLCLALQISLQIREEKLHRQWGWSTITSKALNAFKELQL